MKYLLKYFVITVMALSFFNCVVEPMEFLDGHSNAIVDEIENSVPGASAVASTCDNQVPKARIINNSTVEVNLEIYDVDGNLLASEYNIESGHLSDWSDFSAGEITFLVNNGSSDKIIVCNMETCMTFIIEVDANNQITTNQVHL